MDVNNVQEMWSLGTDDYILAIFQMFLDFDLQSLYCTISVIHNLWGNGLLGAGMCTPKSFVLCLS